MRRSFFFGLCLLLSVLLGMPVAADESGAGANRGNVLMLLSRGPSDVWVSAEVDGMLRVFREAKPSIQPIVEYMDWQAGFTPEQEAKLAAYYASKFGVLKIRTVIAAGEPAPGDGG